MQSDSMQWRKLVAIKEDIFVSAGFDLDNQREEELCISLRHCGATYQAEILGAASGAEKADIEQMKKIVPLITCEIPFGQNISELVFGVLVRN